jgi:DNA polymerase III sliding clamp (beta) subunit (PCNA family)
LEIQVAKGVLDKGLSLVVPSLSKDSDITGHFVFRVANSKVEVLTANGRVFGSCPIEAEVDVESGGFTVEAKRLKQWLQNVGDGDLKIKAVGGEITVISAEGDLPFQSLDPETFPYWDKTLKRIEKLHKKRVKALEKDDPEISVPPPVKFKISAQRLCKALTYAKIFISTQETVTPHLCVTEVKAGSLVATNKATATTIVLDGLEKSTLRIHRNDVTAVVSFLGLAGSDDIELLESDRVTVFRREDGALFGVSKVNDAFPDLDFDQFHGGGWWALSPPDVAAAIQFIKAAADWDDKEVNLVDEGENIQFWMPSAHSKKRAMRSVGCIERGVGVDEDEDVDRFEPFQLDLEVLLQVFSSWKGKTAKVEVYPPNKKRRGGFIVLREDRDGDAYSTVLTFLRGA